MSTVWADQLTIDFSITVTINRDEKLIMRFCISDIHNKRRMKNKKIPNLIEVIRAALF